MPELDVDQLLGADDYATLSVGPLDGSMQTYPYTGLSEAGAAAIILANLGRVGTPIDVTVDGSSDGGATWTELASASAVISTHTLLVDAPPDAIRVTLVGEAESVEVRLRPFRSGAGGGGSQPGAVRWLGPCKTNAFAGQNIGPSDVIEGGTYTLTLNGETTAPIDWDATVVQVYAALEALPSVGVGNVVVNPRNPGISGLAATLNDGLEFLFKDLTAITMLDGDLAGLTGAAAPYRLSVGTSDILIEMFTPAVDDIIEDFMHVVVASFPGSAKLYYTDSISNPTQNGPAWSVPNVGQGVDGLDLAVESTTDFTNFSSSVASQVPTGQPTALLALIDEWATTSGDSAYTTIPAKATNAVPIYSLISGVDNAPTQGEVWIWVKVSTPAPLMD